MWSEDEWKVLCRARKALPYPGRNPCYGGTLRQPGRLYAPLFYILPYFLLVIRQVIFPFVISPLCLSFSYSSGYPQALPFFIKKKERRREGRRAERKYRRIRNAVSWKKASGRISIMRLKAGSNSQFPCEKKRR